MVLLRSKRKWTLSDPLFIVRIPLTFPLKLAYLTSLFKDYWDDVCEVVSTLSVYIVVFLSILIIKSPELSLLNTAAFEYQS